MHPGFVLLHWAVGLARPGAGVAGKPAAAAAAAARRQLVARQEALAHFDSGVVSIHSGGGGGTNGSASAAQRALLQSSSTSSVNGSADRYQRTLLQNDNASAGAAESGLGGTGIKATAVKSDGSSWQRAVRMAFYLWVSAANLVAVSTMWARAADAFHPNAAARCPSSFSLAGLRSFCNTGGLQKALHKCTCIHHGLIIMGPRLRPGLCKRCAYHACNADLRCKMARALKLTTQGMQFSQAVRNAWRGSNR